MTGARSRLSDFPPRAALGTGMPPSELWGVATKNPKPRHKQGEVTRSAKARARLALRRRARAKGMSLKAFIRKEAGR